MPKILEVKNLTKKYGPQTVLENLSFQIFEGQKIALFAPSGSGKTTLFKILTHIEKQDEGSFHFYGKKLGCVFQEPRLFPFLTLQENMLYTFRIQKKSYPQKGEKSYDIYQNWLEISHLKDFQHHYPHEVPGGMQQKVALIRCFMDEPDLLLLDEAFKSLDFKSREKIIAFILQKYPQIALLLISHHQEETQNLVQESWVFEDTPLSEYSSLKNTALLTYKA